MSPKTNVSKSEIFKIISFFQIFYLPFGLCRIKCENGKVSEIDKSHKMYAAFFIVLFTTFFFYSYHLDAQTKTCLCEKSASLIATNSLYYYFLIFTFIVIVFHSAFLDANITKEIYQDFLEIDEVFKFFGKKYNLHVNLMLILHFVPYFVFKIVYFILSYMFWYKFNMWCYHFANFIIDMEMIRFSIEINVISKSLKILCDNVNNDLIYHVEANKINEVCLINLINIYKKIISTVEKINNCHSTKVGSNNQFKLNKK